MNAHIRRGWSILGALAISSALHAQGDVEVEWLFAPPAVPVVVDPAAIQIPCGSHGKYWVRTAPPPPPATVFVRAAEATHPGPLGGSHRVSKDLVPPVEPFPKCEGCRTGREVVPIYPRQRQFGSGSLLPEAIKAGSPLPIPCNYGSCLLSSPPNSPWVAVVDWADPHGWSVAATILATSDDAVGAVLFKLDPVNLSAFAPRGATDLHVLNALCQIAEHERQGLAPIAINLSFGRKHFPRTGILLEKEVGVVLGFLDQAGIASVAAAGNYRELQFPAAIAPTIPVGMLEIRSSAPRAAGLWETPAVPGSRSAGLLPGAGLCLFDRQANAYAPLPPGSSFSTASFTGWLGWLEAKGLTAFDTASQRWFSERICRPQGCKVTMREAASNVTVSASLGLGALLEPLYGDAAPCGVPPGSGSGMVFAAPRAATDPTATLPSFQSVVNGLKIPSPGSNPCLPCLGGGAERIAARVIAPPPPVDEVATKLYVDFSESLALPVHTQLEQLWLRLGTKFYDLGLKKPELALIETGQLGTLAIPGLPASEVDLGTPSLIFRLADTSSGSEGSIPYWTSVPLWFED